MNRHANLIKILAFMGSPEHQLQRRMKLKQKAVKLRKQTNGLPRRLETASCLLHRGDKGRSGETTEQSAELGSAGRGLRTTYG